MFGDRSVPVQDAGPRREARLRGVAGLSGNDLQVISPTMLKIPSSSVLTIMASSGGSAHLRIPLGTAFLVFLPRFPNFALAL
jgi:hypothetical protein